VQLASNNGTEDGFEWLNYEVRTTIVLKEACLNGLNSKDD